MLRTKNSSVACGVFLSVFLSIVLLNGCQEKTYGAPSNHKCINCGAVATVFGNKRWDADKGMIELYYCDDCYEKEVTGHINKGIAPGITYPWGSD